MMADINVIKVGDEVIIANFVLSSISIEAII
jgi:hypothetical protein